MSVRSGDNRTDGDEAAMPGAGAGAGAEDDARPVEAVEGNSDSGPNSNGTLVLPARKSVMLPEDGRRPSWLSAGMATGEQLDAFRELRTRLLAMAAAVGLQHFTTLVVPVSAGAGASFVARNLAVAFTLQEQRGAILVDCNLRHPAQHLAFDMRADDEGLFDYLEQPRTRAQRLIRATGIGGLYLIPAGAPPSTFREYFSSQAMRSLMAWLRRAPCYLVLDGPPIKGSPDARILSALADFVVLVAGYGRDTVEGISQAAALFEPGKFAGVVFNERG